jgi:hypothetical protein
MNSRILLIPPVADDVEAEEPTYSLILRMPPLTADIALTAPANNLAATIS